MSLGCCFAMSWPARRTRHFLHLYLGAFLPRSEPSKLTLVQLYKYERPHWCQRHRHSHDDMNAWDIPHLYLGSAAGYTGPQRHRGIWLKHESVNYHWPGRWGEHSVSLKFPSNLFNVLIIHCQTVRNTFTRSGNKSGWARLDHAHTFHNNSAFYYISVQEETLCWLNYLRNY